MPRKRREDGSDSGYTVASVRELMDLDQHTWRRVRVQLGYSVGSDLPLTMAYSSAFKM
jgi:hypothetical protein